MPNFLSRTLRVKHGLFFQYLHYFTSFGKIKAISMEREMVYPFISLGDSDTEIIANFGQKEFIYYCNPTTFWDHWT